MKNPEMLLTPPPLENADADGGFVITAAKKRELRARLQTLDDRFRDEGRFLSELAAALEDDLSKL